MHKHFLMCYFYHFTIYTIDMENAPLLRHWRLYVLHGHMVIILPKGVLVEKVYDLHCADFTQPPTSLDSFQHSGIKSINGAWRTRRVKDVMDFVSIHNSIEPRAAWFTYEYFIFCAVFSLVSAIQGHHSFLHNDS